MTAVVQLRYGSVLSPRETAEVASTLTGAPKLEGYSLSLEAPNWLASQMEQDPDGRRVRFGLMTPPDKQDSLLQIVAQSGSAQLRVLFHLNVASVQELLQDAWQRGELRILLGIEHSTAAVVFTTPMPRELGPALNESFDFTRGVRGDLCRALRVGALHTLPGSVPSLVNGQEVTDVVAALVAGDVGELNELEVAGLVQGEPDAASSTLH